MGGYWELLNRKTFKAENQVLSEERPKSADRGSKTGCLFYIRALLAGENFDLAGRIICWIGT